MAEAEDVIVDAARHATEYAQALMRRRRSAELPDVIGLLDVAPRLDLLLAALYGQRWPLRAAQPPAPVTPLRRLMQRSSRPWRAAAVPCAGGGVIWLPRELPGVPAPEAVALYRAMALQQAQRACWRDASALRSLRDALARDVYLVLEALACDAALVHALPGLRPDLERLRAQALQRRPALERFAPGRRALELWLRHLDRSLAARGVPPPADPCRTFVDQALEVARRFAGDLGAEPLLKDWWTGDWPADEPESEARNAEATSAEADDRPVRSARLARRPTVRQAEENEDDAQPGAWMVQTAQPHEHAEDPMGQQRPADRDADTAAEAHAESVSELEQARLVRTLQRAHEVLLSDAPPPAARAASGQPDATGTAGIRYPEWDWRAQAYRDPGTTVWESEPPLGPPSWVERTLEAQRPLMAAVRQRFEMLRADRVILRRQEEGDELDVDACIEARADLRAGAALSQRLYRLARTARRDSAVLVLVDVSGSTDGWVDGRRRVIDVEREALLPLSIALDGCGDPHAILAFSGQGPQRVVVRTVKRFGERHGETVARRIAGLEPERYTRVGAALRHASRLLAAQPARHRLLLLLSDGKPNDEDDYEGRYGVEDLRRAVLEARQAGQSPFCLTVDRQGAGYLPRVFGPHHYALLQQPNQLPVVLVDWMRRLLVS